MFLPAMLLAGAVAASTPPAPSAQREVFRLELAGKQTLWALDRPMQTGGLVVFHRFPDGMLLSIRRTDLVRIVVSKYEPAGASTLKPGSVIEVGMTGGGGRTGSLEGGTRNAGSRPPGLGERKDGTALLNPDRKYKPEWDSKEVPGMNIPYPASPNDYREGRTFAYPPSAATQSAPGDLPRARTETGEPPRAPNQ